MRYVGIDAGKKHCVCILEENEKKVCPNLWIRNCKDDYTKLASLLKSDDKICIESTGSYSLPIYRFLKDNGHDIIMVSGRKSRELRRFLFSDIKTDDVDAEVLAHMRLQGFKLKKSRVTPKMCNKLNILIHEYCEYNKDMVRIKNRIIAVIQKTYPEINEAFRETASLCVLGTIRWIDDPKTTSVRKVLSILKERGINSRKAYISRVLDALNNSVGFVDDKNAYLHALIDSFFRRRAEIERVENEMAVELLKTPYASIINHPCIGLISASALVGCFQDITRFENHHSFTSFCGFKYSRDQSGQKDIKKYHITMNNLLWIFGPIAVTMIYHDPKIKEFAERLKKRGKHMNVVKFAVVRKILIRLYFDFKRMHQNTLEDNLRLIPASIPYSAVKTAIRTLKAEIA